MVCWHVQVESILKPVRGIRDAQRRAGVTPTNHSRHNMLAVKEQSRLNALQKLQQHEQPTQDTGGTRDLRRTLSSGSRGGAAGTAAGGGGSGGSSSSSCCRNFVEENRMAAAAAAAAKRPVKAEAKQEVAPGGYLHKTEYGQVCGLLHEVLQARAGLDQMHTSGVVV